MPLNRTQLCGLASCLLVASLTSPVSAQTPSTLDKARATGTITVAYREASIPFSYLGADAQPTGFGWEICGRIVEQVKRVTGRQDLTLRTQAITAQNRIPLIVNGTADIECGSASAPLSAWEVVSALWLVVCVVVVLDREVLNMGLIRGVMAH